MQKQITKTVFFAVLFFSVFGLAGNAKAAELLFSDDFESGSLTGWITSAVSMSDELKRSGNHSVKAIHSDTVNLRRNIDLGSEFYAEWWWYTSSTWPNNSGVKFARINYSQEEAGNSIWWQVANPLVWQAEHSYSVGRQVKPVGSSSEPLWIYTCTQAGVSGTSEPVWPTTINGTVTDGSAVWTATEWTVAPGWSNLAHTKSLGPAKKSTQVIWESNHVYTSSSKIYPTAGGDGYIYELSAGGTSGSTEPNWSTYASGAEITDGTLVWTKNPLGYSSKAGGCSVVHPSREHWIKLGVYAKSNSGAGLFDGIFKVWIGDPEEDFDPNTKVPTCSYDNFSWNIDEVASFIDLEIISNISKVNVESFNYVDDLKVYDGIPNEESDTTPPASPSGLSVN